VASHTDGIRLVHVDDDPELAAVTAEFLEREDGRLSVETAVRAREALELLDEREIDCIVSDYDMPDLSGIEFLEAVREDHPDLPFILYTGEGSQEVASDAIAAGVTEYLQKESGVGHYAVLANRIVNAVDQYRNMERAAALERTRRIHQDVNQALVRAQTRAEIEERVCRFLSEADPYRFAWIGAYDSECQTVVPRASAGDAGGFLEQVTVSVGGWGPAEGPTGRAIRHREVATSWTGAAGAADEGWVSAGEAYGFRACAAMPLGYDEHRYGVLTVYSERAGSVDDRERELFEEMGADIAHAIRRVESEQTRRRFERALDQAGHAVFITDPTGTIEYVNPAFERITGYSAEEASGETPRLLNSDEMGEDYYNDLWTTILAGETWEREVIDQRKSGELYTADQTIAPITDESGEITAFVAIQNDITEQVERKRELAGAQARFQALTENVDIGVLSLDDEHTIQYANDTVEDLLGYAPADLEGESLSAIIPKLNHETHHQRVERSLDSDDDQLDWRAVDLPVRHAEGHEVPLAISFGEPADGTNHVTALLRTAPETPTLGEP
jgi:PAS domain S-box-containing protein